MKKTDVIYVLSLEEKDCGVQYVGLTCINQNLEVFLSSPLKRLLMMSIPLIDIEMFSGMN